MDHADKLSNIVHLAGLGVMATLVMCHPRTTYSRYKGHLDESMTFLASLMI